MHYEVRFTGTRLERDEQALKEVKRYLGRSGWRRLVDVARETVAMPWRVRVKWARMFCMMNGISGKHPVRAVIKVFLVTKASPGRVK